MQPSLDDAYIVLRDQYTSIHLYNKTRCYIVLCDQYTSIHLYNKTRCICILYQKDTIEHVFDAVDRSLRLVELLEFLAQVKELVEMRRQIDVLARRFGQQTHPQMQLTISAEAKRSTAMIRMDFLGAQEPFELQTTRFRQLYSNI